MHDGLWYNVQAQTVSSHITASITLSHCIVCDVIMTLLLLLGGN